MPQSKYLTIYKDLKEKIDSGLYPQGEFLPSEHTLIDQYHCSRNTVRRAINQLADEGYVQSRHGKGVIVIRVPDQHSAFTIGNIESMREAAARNGMTYHTKVISFDEDVIDQAMSVKTGFRPGTHVWVIKRLRFLDDEVMIIDTNWLDQEIVPEFSPGLAEQSLYQYLENDLNIQIVTSLRKLTVEKSVEEDHRYMNLKDYNCVVLVSSRTFNSEGIQFEYTESRHRPDRFVFYNQAKRYP